MTDNDKDLRKNDEGKEAPKSTDPQEKMEGPLSSLMQNIKESSEENDSESKEEADEKKNENT